MGEKWLIDTKPDGTELYLDFESGDIVSIRERIPESTIDRLKAETRERAADYRPGGQIGNTQRHVQPTAEIPISIYNLWLATLGDPKMDPDARKAWNRRLNSNEWRDLRTGGGQL